MGGIMNYEKAFFTDEYKINNPEDEPLIQRLKDVIADQIPLLELCVQIHRAKVDPLLYGLHQRIEECFAKMKESVIGKYGQRVTHATLQKNFLYSSHFCL